MHYATTTSYVRFIDRELRRVEVNHGGIISSYPLNPIPDPLFQAMMNAVDSPGSSEERLKHLYISGLMKPTVCSVSMTRAFPINTATKVSALSLSDNVIEDWIDDLEGLMLAWQGRPFESTLDERIDLYRRLLSDEQKIDRFRLCAVELYGESTYSCIQRDPRVALHFRWRDGNSNYSYQLNCIAQIIPPGEPIYRYAAFMRALFSKRLFTLNGRADYVCAYCFWVIESYDKRLVERPGFTSQRIC